MDNKEEKITNNDNISGDVENSEDLKNTEVLDSSEDESTIFSKSAITVKKPKKKKKALVLIVSIVAALVLAGGIGTIVWLLPESTKEEMENASPTIKILENSSENISKITIKNKYGNFTLKSSTKTDSSSNQTTLVWGLEGYDASIIADSYLSSMADSAATLYADRQMTNEEADYGFENPEATVNVIGKNGLKDYNIIVGKLCPDGSGYYLKTSAKEGIYLVTPSTVNYYCQAAEELVNNSIIGSLNTDALDKSYISENDTLDHIDGFTLSGKFYEKPIKVEYIGKNLVAYRLTSPISRYADADAVANISSILQNGIVANNAYKISPSSEDIKKYGLDNPDVILTLNLSGTTTNIKATLQPAKDQEDQYYAFMLNNINVIYRVSKDALSGFDLRQSDFYNRFAFLEEYESFSNMTFTVDNQTYSFNISYKQENNTTTVTHNGKKADDALLRAYFEYFTTLKPDVQSEYPQGPVAMTASFKFRETGKITTIKFISINDRRYIINIDGNNEGVINYTTFDNFVKYIKNVSNGKEIPQVV